MKTGYKVALSVLVLGVTATAIIYGTKAFKKYKAGKAAKDKPAEKLAEVPAAGAPAETAKETPAATAPAGS